MKERKSWTNMWTSKIWRRDIREKPRVKRVNNLQVNKYKESSKLYTTG